MYISAKEAAKKWGISERRVRILCSEGRVDGVLRSSWAWNIPSDTPKPGDGRQLRHMKNHDLRIGIMDFSHLDTERQTLDKVSDPVQFLRSYHQLIARFILAAFATEDITVQAPDLAVLFNQCFVLSMQFQTQLLALNLRSALLRMLNQYGLGPIPGKIRPLMSEQRLMQLYQQLMQGLEGEDGGFEYRKTAADEQEKCASVTQQMETLFVQYERDWPMLHPVVRAVFLYGELVRIRPFGRYDGLLACLALAQELIFHAFPPALASVDHADEFKAAMILTRSRGNYQTVLRMLEQMLLYELSVLKGN